MRFHCQTTGRQALMVGVVYCLLSPLGVAWADDSSTLSTKVDALFRRWDRSDSAGFVVGVIRDGKFVHSRGYGMASLDEGTPITSRTVFRIMSAAKSFTSVCAAIAMDQGLFAPDDDVRKYVPELHKYDGTITVRHLITCHSGLRDFWHGIILLGRDAEDRYSSRDVLDLISRQKTLLFEPGERWGYSNSDFFLLALIIERTSGKTMRQFADDHLFKPLGMTDTFYDDSPGHTIKNRAVGHGHDGTVFYRLELNTDAVGPWQLRTTLNDMLRWDAFLARSPLPAGKYLEGFLEQGSLLGNENCLSAFPNKTHREFRRIWYTGGGMGFMAHYLRFPHQNLSIVAFANHTTTIGWMEMERVLPRVADLYVGTTSAETIDATAQHQWSDSGEKELSVAQRAELATRVGPYQLPRGDFVELVVDQDQNQLILNRISESWNPLPEPLVVLGENRFRNAIGDRDFELSFESPDDSAREQARPTVLIRYVDGETERWKPVQFVEHENLQGFVGPYYCEDLDSVYNVTAADGKLYVQLNFGRRRLFRPTTDLSFIPVNERHVFPIQFSRARDGKVTGFTTGFDRSGVVKFTKVQQ